jgi:chromosomal replication initiation ATPase DnaA
LGSSEFVEGLLAEAEEREKETLRLSVRGRGLDILVKEIAKGEDISEKELRSGKRSKKVSKARRMVCQVAVDRLGYPGAEVARVLGVTTSAVVRAAQSGSIPGIRKYL